MTNAAYAEDDDGFLGYVETTHDPGHSLLFATILFCIISYCSLPFLIAMGNKLDVKNQQSTVRRRSKSSKKRSKWRNCCWKAKQPQPPQQQRLDNISDAFINAPDPIFEATEGPEDALAQQQEDCDSSIGSIYTAPSISSIASQHTHRTHKRRNYRNKRSMEKRHEWEEFELRLQTGLDNQLQKHPNESDVLSPLDHDEVSVADAISLVPTNTSLQRNPLLVPNAFNNNNVVEEIPSTEDGGWNVWDTLLDLVTWDFESKRLIKLAIPFATQALSTGILEGITVAVIGKLLGTKEVSAFVTVRALIDLSSKFFGGFHESIATLCSQAMGRHNYKLVGSYVQLSMIFYVLCYIPFIVLWNVYMYSILQWFGFDAETAEIGREYTQVYLILELIDGVDESIHGLLDVIDLESYSTLVGVSQELVTFLDILCCALLAKPSLYVIGLIELFVAVVFIGINVGTIIWRGWFEPYREGLIGTCALYNKPAAKMMLGTASSLSLGYLLTDGEWEILTLFASHLGPAEVTAWGILGVLWDIVEQLIEAVADASEVRCAFLLGSEQPAKAKRSAHKSIFLGVFLSLFLTSFVFMAGEDLATWFTNDPTLQHIIADLIPLFGIGNLTLTVGTICWTLLGSQGRYRLATVVAFIASWFVTLPLAALFTFQLNINLQGNVAAVVIGYMVSGSINACFLFRSDWEALSRSVREANLNENEVASPPDFLTEQISPALLPNPTLSTLGPLIEGKPGEESFIGSDDDSVDGLTETPDSTPEKEIV